MIKLLSRGGPKAAAMAMHRAKREWNETGLSTIASRFVQFIADMFRTVDYCFAEV
jgi:hypothetical protein